jgi:hypothetical protein
MSELENLIRDALESNDVEAGQREPLVGLLADRFLHHTRWASRFAWMKMSGTLLISTVSAFMFFGAETTQAQIGWATVFLTGFVGFAMWWIWYWMLLNRNASIREIKRLELQLAQMKTTET